MKRLCLFVAAVTAAAAAHSQIRLGDGQLSGSFETNTIGYVNDAAISALTPDDHFGSNNYLKADYTYGRFSAGLQADAYLPALQGYELGQQPDYRKFYLSSKYIQWQDKNYSVMVGDIFDQFGNGLVLRSFEDRQLGFNNSIEGIRASYDFGGYVQVKALYGRPRLYTEYAGSWVRGGDISVSLADIAGWHEGLLQLEGSYVNRFEHSEMGSILGLSPSVNLYSGRLNFGYKGFSLRSEYVEKSKDINGTGRAVLAELGYAHKGFSASGTFRMLDQMATKISLDGNGSGNTINYLPALTRQYTYMLANLEPYQMNADGELAGQLDLYYSLRNKSDRHKYWLFHANFSTAYTLRKEQSSTGKHEILWREVSVDVERQWNRSWKSSLLYTRQEWNPSHGGKHLTYVSHVFVGDATYKIDRKKSLRFELQYLLSADYQGDWVAGLVEFNLAPHWSFFVQDMYNLEATAANDYKKLNYYNGGVSYTHGRTRVQLSYGRNREGYICSGGVCRYSPAYTGVNLALTSSF